VTPRRVCLAVNPTSGRGRGQWAGVCAAEVLTSSGVDVIPLRAAGGPELADLVRARLAEGLDALVVVGGDGMVNLGVNAVAGTPVPLGIVAAGTGNDIARALGLPVGEPAAATVTALTALSAPAPRRVDGVRCLTASRSVLWFAGVLGAGFDAIVNERANRWSWPRGPIRYNLAVARELPVFRPREYRLELDDEVWETSAMLVAVANGPSYGGGMRVCPDARIDDGLLDVLVVEPISRLELVRIFPRVYAGTHVRHPKVVLRRARRVRVAAEGIVGYADGERMAALPLTCEAVPAAVNLLAPAPAPDRPEGDPDDGSLHADGVAG
jgi:diacylglycerol kinase (ATP)